MIANFMCCLLIGFQIVYGQNASSASAFDGREVGSKALRTSAFQPAAETGSSSSAPLSDKLRAVLLRIENETNIPVLVPAEIAQSNSKRNVCVTGGSNRDAYVITISEEPECGANAGMIASFTAERNASLPEKSEVDKVIPLANGIEGFYTAKSCGASCAPPQIEFVYENVLYTFQFRASENGADSDESAMIELVNSSINRQTAALRKNF